MKTPLLLVGWCLVLAGVTFQAGGAVYNLKVVTDATPDYSDLPSLIHSATGSWDTPEQKCWALFYWNHQARRQTSPMILHGLALTDPIRQFNDYGYTMCSTIAGINCAIWDAMGFPTRYWDITRHTVSEVFYNGRWHMYDNSMTALYTLCDGVTLAGVEEIGAPGACAASQGITEPGHVARYHCLTATSPRGFLTGADTIRSLEEEYLCFHPNGLKLRTYFRDWDRGHRYILNLRQGESYTRHYHSLGDGPEYYVPNEGRDPESVNTRYRIRGNGVRTFHPSLDEAHWKTGVHDYEQIAPTSQGGLGPTAPATPAWVVFKVEGAHVITALRLRARAHRETTADLHRIEVSTVHGLHWQPVWEHAATGTTNLDLPLVNPVNGAYEVLVRVSLQGQTQPTHARLEDISFETITMLNSKTQPGLRLGKNIVHVETGSPTESIVLWPDLQGSRYQACAVAEQNLATAESHPGYMGVMHAHEPGQDAFVVFRLDAPRPLTRIEYGGRLYNRAPGSRIEFLHSFDGGQTWQRSYSLTNTAQPWDVIHFETDSAIPAGARSVWLKYLLRGPQAGPNACSLYAVRMEAHHEPAPSSSAPLDITFQWSERQADYSLVERRHTERVTTLPHRYPLCVGGADHPVVRSLHIAVADPKRSPALGYSDGHNAGGQKFTPRWVRYGQNLARGKPYTVSVPSTTQWDAGDPDGTKLTDGVLGPPYPGGIAPRSALCWNQGQDPVVQVDLGQALSCGAFRIQLGAGWPWWDALQGQIRDQVEVLTSHDAHTFHSHGWIPLNLRWKDLPVNHFWPDEEIIAAHPFELILPSPVSARHVQFRIIPARTLTVSEVEVLDTIHYEPFDLRVALPPSSR